MATSTNSTTVSKDGKGVVIDKEVSSRYEVGALLGTGSYGSVFAAIDRITQQSYAVKVVSRERLGPDGEPKIEMEVNIMKLLDHPRILRMVNYIPSERHYNIVMEKVDGGELFNHLLKVKRYTEKKACRVIFNLLRALKHMHDRGIMHCDIKPENLLLVKPPTNDEEVTNIKLADFGLATSVKPPNFPTKACGSPLYIAPEVLECGLTKTRSHYTEAADLWSVGIITYLLVSGMIPFFGKSPNEIFKAVLHTNHNFKHKAWEPISDLAKDFINMLLVKDPEHRPTCAEALQHEWIQIVVAEDGEEGDRELPATLEGLKKFNAQEKLKGAMYGVEATFRMAYLSRCSKAKIKPNSQVVEVLTNATEPIRKIDLSGNYLGPKGLQTLMAALSDDKSTHVEEINLHNTLFDDTQLLELVSLVYSDPKTTTTIGSPSSNSDQQQQQQHLSPHQRQDSQHLLQSDPSGVSSSLFPVSSPSTPSTMPARGSLVIGETSLGRFEPISRLASVKTINLSNNELTHASGRIIIDLVRRRPNIIHVDVSGNHIKEAIMKKIQAQCTANKRQLNGEEVGAPTDSSSNNTKAPGSSVGGSKTSLSTSSRRTSLMTKSNNNNHNSSSIAPSSVNQHQHNSSSNKRKSSTGATTTTTAAAAASVTGGGDSSSNPVPSTTQQTRSPTPVNTTQQATSSSQRPQQRRRSTNTTTITAGAMTSSTHKKVTNSHSVSDRKSAVGISVEESISSLKLGVSTCSTDAHRLGGDGGGGDVTVNNNGHDDDTSTILDGGSESASPVGGARGLLLRRKQQSIHNNSNHHDDDDDDEGSGNANRVTTRHA